VQPSKTATANTIPVRDALGFFFVTRNHSKGMHFPPKKGHRVALKDRYCKYNPSARCAWIFFVLKNDTASFSFFKTKKILTKNRQDCD